MNTIVRIAVINERTKKEVKGYAVKGSNGKDITKFRWGIWDDDGYFQADQTICYFDGKLGNGLYLTVVDCTEGDEK